MNINDKKSGSKKSKHSKKKTDSECESPMHLSGHSSGSDSENDHDRDVSHRDGSSSTGIIKEVGTYTATHGGSAGDVQTKAGSSGNTSSRQARIHEKEQLLETALSTLDLDARINAEVERRVNSMLGRNCEASLVHTSLFLSLFTSAKYILPSLTI